MPKKQKPKPYKARAIGNDVDNEKLKALQIISKQLDYLIDKHKRWWEGG